MKKNNTTCCDGCKTDSRPWRFVEDYVRDRWNGIDLDVRKSKPCICFNGPGAPSIYTEIEDFFLNSNIQTKITTCGDKMKIAFISNGDDAHRSRLTKIEEMNKIQAELDEKARLLKLEEEKQRIPNFRNHLIALQESGQFPFNYLSDLSEVEMEGIKVVEDGTPPREIFQLYILHLKDGGIYVGETGLGYPWRVYNHIRGHKAAKCTKNNLTYEQHEWEKNLVQELMEIIQPIDKKYPCTHIFEWWLQQEMLKQKIRLSGGEAKTGSTGRWKHTCEICNEIARENNLPWKSLG